MDFVAQNSTDSLGQNISEQTKKMTLAQKRSLIANRAILAIAENRPSAAWNIVKKTMKEDPDNYDIHLVLVSLLLREQKNDKAIHALKVFDRYLITFYVHTKLLIYQEFCDKIPSSLSDHLCLVHMLISKSSWIPAITVLENFSSNSSSDIHFRPGFISLMVWIYKKLAYYDKALNLLERAVSYWNNQSFSLVSDNILNFIAIYAFLQSLNSKYYRIYQFCKLSVTS